MYYDFEHQVLLGTILGGSSLVRPPKGRNYYVSMRSNNERWLQWKADSMPRYFKNQKMRLYGQTHRCNSSCCEELTELYSTLYSGNERRITMQILDVLQDTGLAVWFLDGGSKTGRGRKNAYLNTTRFGYEGTQIVQQYFTEVEMDCTINRDKDRWKILFTVEGTVCLLKTIAHRFPNFMYDRL